MEKNNPAEARQKQIQIKAKDDDLKGSYSNLMVTSHTKEEFCLDFINNFNPPVLVSRVLVNPNHLKRMIKLLQENMKKYEDQFGEIESAKEPETKIGFQSKS